MSVNRRNFLKVLGVTGLSLGTGSKLKAAPVNRKSDKEFYAILYDSTRCIACQSCEFACASANGLPEPDYDDYPEVGKVRQADENRRTVINAYPTDDGGEVYIKNQCMHCSQPACASACLTEAMKKTEEGPVVWRGEKCMGCRYCMVSCPFDVPKFEYHSANPRIQKCNMCHDRIVEGGKPACVSECPAEALVFGTRKELLAEARKRIAENPDLYYDHIYGENEAGGTGYLYLSSVPFEKLGMKTNIQNSSYPALTKGFLYSVPSIFVLWPAMLLGLHNATKNKNREENSNE